MTKIRIVVAVSIISLTILIHELGHFSAARFLRD
jgi:membrane-associated protease RseP (regulator of RpoE activity)